MTVVSDELYEMLVAYTQKRSDAEQVRQVESLLTRSAAAREVLQSIQEASAALNRIAAIADSMAAAHPEREESLVKTLDRRAQRRRFAAAAVVGLGLAAAVAFAFVLQRPPVVGRATDAGNVALREEGWRQVRAGEELEAAEGLLRIRLLDGEDFKFNQGSIARVRSDGVDLLRGRVWARSAERRITIGIGGYVLRMGPRTEAELMLRQVGTTPRVRVRVSEEAVLVGPHPQERRLSAGEMLEVDVCEDKVPRLP